MKIKVFYPDRDGRISFTKKELEDLLDEVYREGYNDGRPYAWTNTYYPSNVGTITTTPLRGDQFTYTTTSSNTSADYCIVGADIASAVNQVKYSSQSIQYVET